MDVSALSNVADLNLIDVFKILEEKSVCSKDAVFLYWKKDPNSKLILNSG